MKNFTFLFAVILLCAVLLATGGCAPSVNTEDPAYVTFQFSHKGQNVSTAWRKIEGDTHGSRFFAQTSKWALTMMSSSLGAYKAHTIRLDPGTYYLDTLEVRNGNWIFTTGRGGWNSEAGAPYYFSFTVHDGQQLVLPPVEINVEGSGRNAAARFKYEDPENILTAGEKVLK